MLYVHLCFKCICVYSSPVDWEPAEVRRVYQKPCYWSYKCLWATMWVLIIHHKSFARAACILVLFSLMFESGLFFQTLYSYGDFNSPNSSKILLIHNCWTNSPTHKNTWLLTFNNTKKFLCAFPDIISQSSWIYKWHFWKNVHSGFWRPHGLESYYLHYKGHIELHTEENNVSSMKLPTTGRLKALDSSNDE